VGWETIGYMIGNAYASEMHKRREQQREQEAREAARPDPRRFAPIVPPLPAEDWVEAQPFRAGYPWGWQAHDHEAHNDPYDRHGARQLMLLATPRADQRTVGIAAQSLGPRSLEELLDSAADLHDARAQGRRLDRYGDLSCVLVDGEPGLLIHLRGRSSDPGLTDITAITSEVWVQHGGILYMVDLLGPESDYAGYLQAFWTVLGTWKWR